MFRQRRIRARFHGAGPFDVDDRRNESEAGKDTLYRCVFQSALQISEGSDKKVVAITAAMADGTGLAEIRRSIIRNGFLMWESRKSMRVTFAAGLAAGGMKPVFAVYSSFLQRAYDQIIHDVCASESAGGVCQ